MILTLINKPENPKNDETNDVTRLNDNDDAIINVVNGQLDDDNIKDYTVDDTSSFLSDTNPLSKLFNTIGSILKAITGKTNWYDSPSIDLESINDGSVKVGDADLLDGVQLADISYSHTAMTRYTDGEAISAINNDGDHGSTAQHNYSTYGDNDAISAINNDGDHGSTAQHNYNTYDDADARSAINNDNDHGSTASHNYNNLSTGDVNSSNWGDYELQKNGTDGNGIINFKTG